MVKYKLSILFLFIALSSFAQQGLQMDFGEIDSTEMALQRSVEYYQFINGTLGSDNYLTEFKLPEFNPLQVFQSPQLILNFSPQLFNGISPFYNGEILSQAAYSLGDKFIVGGFSYGTNSALSTPAHNMRGSYFDTYGSTMFMKYKVSKSVSIETRISVGQNHGVGF